MLFLSQSYSEEYLVLCDNSSIKTPSRNPFDLKTDLVLNATPVALYRATRNLYLFKCSLSVCDKKSFWTPKFSEFLVLMPGSLKNFRHSYGHFLYVQQVNFRKRFVHLFVNRV